MLLWDELKLHINPAEVDSYARQIGISRITRNEEAFNELATLRQMQNTLQDSINDEIEKKNPLLLACPQRTRAVASAIKALDSLRDHGRVVDPEDPADSQVLKYLKFTRAGRPSTDGGAPVVSRGESSVRSARSVGCSDNGAASTAEMQSLMDDEYSRLQTEIADIRCALFSSCDELHEVKALEPPPTASIEQFNKRLQTQELVVTQIARSRGSAVTRLRDSVRLSRLWD
jgi:hypothetical protein